ncbi:MAG: DUF4365 domain-containing protein [Actinomycetota bacterium]
MTATYAVEGLGSGAVKTEFGRWGWAFRADPVAGFGIDAHVEPAGDQAIPGSLIALQIKAGPSYFSEPAVGGWLYRGSDPHLSSWLRHCLPVVLLVHNPEAGVTYWAHVHPGAVTADGSGWQVLLPSAQVLSSTARADFTALAQLAACATDDPVAQSGPLLPPSAAEIIDIMGQADAAVARRLAAWLAHGREGPRLAAESLLAASPSWLAAGQGHGERALAAYADEHGLPDLAAEAFTRAAGYRQQPGGTLLAHATLAAARAGDGDRARMLFSLAANDDPPGLLLATADAAVQNLEGSAPADLPPSLVAATPADRAAEPACLSFLGAWALHCGDPDAAVRYFEEGCATRPASTAMMLLLAEALAARAAAAAPGPAPADLCRIEEASRAALEQRRRWSGCSSQALALLIRRQMLAGAFESAVQLAIPAPAGEALGPEASADDVVILATQAALTAGDRDRAVQFAARAGSAHAAAVVGALLDGRDPPVGA